MKALTLYYRRGWDFLPLPGLPIREAVCPAEIARQAICINSGIENILEQI